MATKLNFLQYTYRIRINHKTLYSQTFHISYIRLATGLNSRAAFINVLKANVIHYDIHNHCSKIMMICNTKITFCSINIAVTQHGRHRDVSNHRSFKFFRYWLSAEQACCHQAASHSLPEPILNQISVVIWRHYATKCGLMTPYSERYNTRPESTLAQTIACYPTAPNHYLKKCWRIISMVLWQSFEGIFKTRSGEFRFFNVLLCGTVL